MGVQAVVAIELDRQQPRIPQVIHSHDDAPTMDQLRKRAILCLIGDRSIAARYNLGYCIALRCLREEPAIHLVSRARNVVGKRAAIHMLLSSLRCAIVVHLGFRHNRLSC